MATEKAQWYWQEGMRFALEGIKLIFILNGAAAVSLLTFAGNTKSPSRILVIALAAFGVGAVVSIFTLLLAYSAQLKYGNAEMERGTSEFSKKWNQATQRHEQAYLPIISSSIFFLAGLGLAAWALWPVSNGG